MTEKQAELDAVKTEMSTLRQEFVHEKSLRTQEEAKSRLLQEQATASEATWRRSDLSSEARCRGFGSLHKPDTCENPRKALTFLFFNAHIHQQKGLLDTWTHTHQSRLPIMDDSAEQDSAQLSMGDFTRQAEEAMAELHNAAAIFSDKTEDLIDPQTDQEKHHAKSTIDEMIRFLQLLVSKFTTHAELHDSRSNKLGALVLDLTVRGVRISLCHFPICLLLSLDIPSQPLEPSAD